MTKKAITKYEVDDKIRSNGLIKFVSTLPPKTRKDGDMISAIASAASMQTRLISKDDKAYLNEIEDIKFFYILAILCKVIPITDTSPMEMMNLVGFLVKRSQQDLTKNEPNAAFLKWCETDLSRANEVIRLAKDGDSISLRHLTFALQAKGDVRDAISCLERSPQEQKAGALALSRMQLDEAQSSIALEKTISLAIAADTQTTYQFTRSAYNIAAKQPRTDRSKLSELLNVIFISDNEWAIYLAATLINHHHKEMTKIEFDLCLDKIAKVDPKHKGTIKEIQQAMICLLETGKIHAASYAIYKMIQASREVFKINTPDSFFRELIRNHSKSLAILATDWLQRGDSSPCSTLARATSKLSETEPVICVYDIPLPSSTKAQIFLCKKAVGYFFFQPVTAAAFSVAVMDRGHPEAKKVARKLLFNPLLISYGHKLPNWLKAISTENENCRQGINEVLNRAEEVLNGFKSALEVVELEPSRSKRDVVAFQRMEEAEQIQEAAQKRSFFANIIKNEYMLYGDETAISAVEISSGLDQKTIPYSKIEIIAELPKGIFFDSVRLEMMLDQFRYERIAEK